MTDNTHYYILDFNLLLEKSYLRFQEETLKSFFFTLLWI